MTVKVMGASWSLRIGFGIVAIIATVEILQTQAVLNAILLFGAAGIVPGTDIVLSPEATMWSLGGLLLASILLIFHKEIIVACMPTTSVAAPVERVEQPTNHFVVVRELEAAPTKQRPAIASKLFERARRQLARVLSAHSTIDFSQCRIQFFKTYALTIVRLRNFWAGLQPVLSMMLARLRVEARPSWLIARRVAGLCLARVVAFDHWATAKIQQRDDLAEIQKMLRLATKVLVDWTIQARNFLARFSQKINR